MTTNDVPTWLPVFNLVASLAAMLLAIPGFRSGWTVAYRSAFAVSLVILLGGALFQANILPLWAWVLIGSGGRLAVLALVVVGLVASWPSRRA